MKGLFPKYEEKTLDDYKPSTPSQKDALAAVEKYLVDPRAMWARGHGLTFLGPEGVGKTHLAENVLRGALMTPYRKAVIGGVHRPECDPKFCVESIQASAFMDLHQDRMDIKKKEEYEEYQEARDHIRRIESEIHFVLFDDVGREHNGVTDWTAHLLFNTLRTRSNHNLPYLITSNLSLEALTKRYTRSFVSLLHEDTDIIEIRGVDYRAEGTARH